MPGASALVGHAHGAAHVSAGAADPDARSASAHPRGVTDFDRDTTVPADGVELPGRLVVPGGASGLVVFAHGSGSSRLSPRNQQVAAALNAAGLGTFLFDLLAPAEAARRQTVFDVDLLARRLVAATRSLRRIPESSGLRVGYFGASTGAAAALVAAAEAPEAVHAVVARGGRPDLAGGRLADVLAPTLLIVGGEDRVVLELNREARAQLGGPSELAIIPGATHLFEEPGALAQVSSLALRWFLLHLVDEGGHRG